MAKATHETVTDPRLPREEEKRPTSAVRRRDDIPAALNPFLLEDLFPNPIDFLRSNLINSAADSDVMVAIDTNALLLPYGIGKNDLGALATAYRKLASEGRLFLPARCAREFIKLRDQKVADLLQTMNDVSSKISIDGVSSPILEGLDGYDELKQASHNLVEGRKIYLKALARIRSNISAWKGDDPVTALYADVFTIDNIVQHQEDRDTLQSEWTYRLANKIPPGYKDAAKSDSGIGDFFIWKSLLSLGRENKKDLVFVTGEEKADWFVRSGREPVFVRPELVVEYRAASDGRNLHLSSLAELLRQFGTADEIVEEVRSAEESANSIVRMRASNASQIPKRIHNIAVVTSGQMDVNYSIDGVSTSVMTPLGSIELRFHTNGPKSAILSLTRQLVAIVLLRGVASDTVLNMDEFDASSDDIAVGEGDAFAALNTNGEILIGRVLQIYDISKSIALSRIRFDYRIFNPGMQLSSP